MGIPSFYFQGQPEQEERLKGENFRHIRALRLKVGDNVILFDGKGRQSSAIIKELTPNQAVIEIMETKTLPRPSPGITIASALPKGKRQAFLVEKLAELGVERFIPIITQRTIVRPRPGGVEKLKKNAIEAASQGSQAWTMEIEEPIPFEQAVQLNKYDLKIIATPKGAALKEILAKKEQNKGNIICLVGPEGNFTDDEISLAEKNGFEQASLGKTLLRVETAAITIAAMINYACK